MILRYVIICATASEDKSSKSNIIAYIIIILIKNDYYLYIYVHAYLDYSSVTVSWRMSNFRNKNSNNLKFPGKWQRDSEEKDSKSQQKNKQWKIMTSYLLSIYLVLFLMKKQLTNWN